MINLRIYSKLPVMLLIIFLHAFVSAAEEGANEDLKEEEQVQVIQMIPQIGLTEVNSLKTYAWWKSSKPKFSKILKLFLKKMKADFLEQKIQLKFVSQKLDEKGLAAMDGDYVLSGDLMVNSKDRKNSKLVNLSFYQIKNMKLSLIHVSKVAEFSLSSNFRPLAHYILNPNFERLIDRKDQLVKSNSKEEFLISFKNELNFDELNQIKSELITGLGLKDDTLLSLYTSENSLYVFKLVSKVNPYQKIKNLIFVKGPYQSTVEENSITFSPVVETSDEL